MQCASCRTSLMPYENMSLCGLWRRMGAAMLHKQLHVFSAAQRSGPLPLRQKSLVTKAADMHDTAAEAKKK